VVDCQRMASGLLGNQLFTQLLGHPKSKTDLLRYCCAEFQLYLNGPEFALKFTSLLCCLELRQSSSTVQGRNV